MQQPLMEKSRHRNFATIIPEPPVSDVLPFFSDFDSTAILTSETNDRTAPPVHRSPVIGNRISPNRENANISTTANVKQE